MATGRGKPLTLDELLKGQQRLAAQGDVRATEQIQNLTRIKKQEEGQAKLVKLAEDTNTTVKKGLVDKSGDGLNSNVIKLLTDIKKSLQHLEDKAFTVDTQTPEKETQPIKTEKEARRERVTSEIDKYHPGGIGYLKDKFNFKTPTEKGVKGYAKAIGGSIKSTFSLKNMFDLSEGASEGFLGQVVRKKVAKDEYVQNRMEVDPTLRNLKPYQTPEIEALKAQKEALVDPGKKASKAERDAYKKQSADLEKQIKEKQDKSVRKGLGNQFDRQQDNRVAARDNERERDRIQKLTDEGYGTNNNTKAVLRNKMEAVDQQEAAIDVKMAEDDPRYRARKAADESTKVVKQAKQGLIGSKKKSSTAPTPITSPLAPPLADVASPAANMEVQDESNRLVAEQTEVLKKIEANTAEQAKPAKASSPQAPSSEQAQPTKPKEGDGLMGNVADFAMDKIGGGASKYLGKVGGLGKLAKGVGIGGIATLAGEGIQAGGDALKEAGWEQTGKAVGVAGTATKYAGYGAMIGSIVPGVGTAVGAGVGGLIGAGKGIYDQYFGDSNTAASPDAPKAEASPLQDSHNPAAKVQPASKEQVAGLTKEQKQYRQASASLADADAKLKKFNEGQEEGKDYKYKTALDEFTNKRSYSDPKKQAEYDAIKKQRFEAESAMQGAVDARMAQDNVLGNKRVDPNATGAKRTRQETRGEFQDADAKIAALVKAGYKREQFETNSNTNYIQTGDGKKYDQAKIDAVYKRDVKKELAGPADAKASINSAGQNSITAADSVYDKSGENAEAAQQASSAPIIINAPSTVNNNQTTNTPSRIPARNTESSMSIYNRSKYAMAG